MAGRHRSRSASIQIIKTATVAAKDCKRVSTLQMHVSTLTSVQLLLLLIKFVCFHAFYLQDKFETTQIFGYYVGPSELIFLLVCCFLFIRFSQNNKLRFPLPHRIMRPATKQVRSLYSAQRPTTHFQ